MNLISNLSLNVQLILRLSKEIIRFFFLLKFWKLKSDTISNVL